MVILQQNIVLTEEDVAKEKGRVTSWNISNCSWYIYLLAFREKGHLDAQEK